MSNFDIRERPEEFNKSYLYFDYYSRLKQLAMTRFKWSGFDEIFNVRYLEDTLFTHGQAIFYHDETYGYVGLKCTQRGRLNLYDEPIEYDTVNVVIKRTLGPADKFVIIRNNLLTESTQRLVYLYAKRLRDIDETIDINLNGQRTPLLLVGTEKQKMTLKNMYKLYKGGAPVIFGDDSLINKDTIQTLDTKTPYLLDKLMVHKANVWNECLSALGINNVNTDKKERLITDEANANNEMIQLSAETCLQTRQEACALINKIFGINVSVEMKQFAKQEINLGIDEPEPDPAGGEE